MTKLTYIDTFSVHRRLESLFKIQFRLAKQLFQCLLAKKKKNTWIKLGLNWPLLFSEPNTIEFSLILSRPERYDVGVC